MNKRNRPLPDYDHWFVLVRLYWNLVLKGVVAQIEAGPEDLILDFGCGQKRLQQYLSGYYVIGYDIVEEYSDVSDYTALKPHTIVCSHVLEHIEMPQLLTTLDNFRSMGSEVLITVQPTENWLSKICNVIGRPNSLNSSLRPVDHKLSITEIHNILLRYYCLVLEKNILTLSIIRKWRPIER